MAQQYATPPQHHDDTGYDTHYCPECRRLQPVELREPDPEDRYPQQQSTGTIHCFECNLQLGHIVWWPTE